MVGWLAHSGSEPFNYTGSLWTMDVLSMLWTRYEYMRWWMKTESAQVSGTKVRVRPATRSVVAL